MLNSYSVANKNIVSTHINAVNGNIGKTYKESFFLRFHLKSKRAEELLCDNPKYYYKAYSSCDVVVIQMVVCGDMEVLCEVIRKEDYNEYFKG